MRILSDAEVERLNHEGGFRPDAPRKVPRIDAAKWETQERGQTEDMTQTLRNAIPVNKTTSFAEARDYLETLRNKPLKRELYTFVSVRGFMDDLILTDLTKTGTEGSAISAESTSGPGASM